MRRLTKVPMLAAVLFLAASVPATYACGEGDPTGSGCCRICREGKACGDSCIAKDKQCNVGVGCACNG